MPDPQQTSGQFTALGLDESGNVQWKYELPAGTQQTAEPIVAGRVVPGKAAQWLLPGSDGSIHILAADGGLIDRFNYGAADQRSGRGRDRRQARALDQFGQWRGALSVER